MKSISISAPGKLMLFGEHAVVFGNPCIVTAVGQRLTLTAQKNDTEEIIIKAPQVGIESFVSDYDSLTLQKNPKGVRFMCHAIAQMKNRYAFSGGLTIVTHSEFTSTVGFGSSSASTVCTIKALSELFDLKLLDREIFDVAYTTVCEIQGKASGFDVAAAVYGGTLYFVTGGTTIEPLSLNNLPLIIGYTGIKADTSTLVAQVAHHLETHPHEVNRIFETITEIVEKAKEAVTHGDLRTIGNLFSQNQSELQKLNVSSSALDTLIRAAQEAGAYGAKLSGAGGGDCMIALAPEENYKAVCSAIQQAGGTIINIPTQVPGVRIES